MDSQRVASFVSHYVQELRAGNAAIFAGAGMSVDAGYVDWRRLVEPLAVDIGLDVSKETDLVAVAQYHFNAHGLQRGKINRVLVENFCSGLTPRENHRILARLPIRTYWTTNYDDLIERALGQAGKMADVKHTEAQLAITKPLRDAVVYKMHGDFDHVDQAVLIKDDYEKYSSKRGLFLNALTGDLVSKTFLFVGVSFSDPNLDYVLSKVRSTLGGNQRPHFCLMRTYKKSSTDTEDDYRNSVTRQKLFIDDLKRFGITTILVEEYGEITDILLRIDREYRRRTIFVSGSAEDFSPWDKDSVSTFLRDLSKVLVQRGYRIVTGLGVGVGDPIVTGAIEEVYRGRAGHLEESLVMRPFPRSNPDAEERNKSWDRYRREMLGISGACLVLFGNKLVDGKLVPANGVRSEVEIARSDGIPVIPIGATGYMAREIWEEMSGDLDRHYTKCSDDIRSSFGRLGNEVSSPDELISPILEFLSTLSSN